MTVAGTASAQQLIKITGSTAFRASTVAGIVNILNNPTAAYVGSSVNGANQAVIRGTLKNGGTDVAFQLAWAGSLGGMQMVTQNLNVPPGTTWTAATTWLSPTNTMSTVSVSTSGTAPTITYAFSGGSALSSGIVYSDTAGATADVTFSDTFQSTTKYNLPGLSAPAAGDVVGVIPFVWVKGAASSAVPSASYARFTNLTQQAAKALLTSGYVNLAQVTGNSADAGVDVVVAGRNDDSGTRFAAFAESGFGQANSPIQFNLTVSGGQITSIATFTPGSNGYASGGTLTNAVNNPPSASATNPLTGRPFIVVCYAGVADAKNVNNGANCLTWNGVGVSNIVSGGKLDVFTTGLANLIQQGQYTFWEYEHIYYRGSIATPAKTAVDLLAAQITSTDAIAAGMYNDVGTTMFSYRNDENSPVVTIY